MPKPSTIELYGECLWDDLDKIEGITETQKNQILRYRSVVMFKLKNPAMTNSDLVRRLNRMFSIKGAQAYRDIAECEPFLATIKNSQREYLRYLLTETQKEAINMARDNNDPVAMSRAANVLGKYNRLDQEDPQRLPFDQIVPQPIEYVNDPTILGLPDVADKEAYVEKVKRKYMVIDAEIIDETKQ